MEYITVLNKFTWPFQFLGLQNVSLNNVNQNSDPKYPSRWFNLVVFFWILWASVFSAFIFYDFKETSGAHMNYLNLVIKFLNFANYSTSIFIAVFSSFKNHSKLVNFFRKAEQISNYFSNEFNYKVNFAKMKKPLAVCYFLYFILFVSLSQFLGYFKQEDAYNKFIKPSFWMIIAIYIQVIVMRFNFYVRVVNFLLESLTDLVKENFLCNHNKFDGKMEIIEVRKICPNEFIERSKVITIRKIYSLIKDMANIINQTMGLVVFLRIFMIITNMIRYGYDFLSDIYGSVDTLSNIICEFCY